MKKVPQKAYLAAVAIIAVFLSMVLYSLLLIIKERFWGEVTPAINTTIEEKMSSYSTSESLPIAVSALDSEEMDFVDFEEYEILLSLYAKLDFFSEFDYGDEALYKNLVQDFLPVLRSEETYVTNKKNNGMQNDEYLEGYVRDLRYFDEYRPWLAENQKEKYKFCLIDMDGDSIPEILMEITLFATDFYIFKYMPEEKNSTCCLMTRPLIMH